ncbi:MAG: AI-2E family transporter [Fervidobacterium sp.]
MNKDGKLLLLYFSLFLFFAWKVPYVIGALVLGFYFSVILGSAYDFVFRKTGKRLLAITSYVLAIFVFVYTIISFFPTTVKQLYALFESLKNPGEKWNNLDLPSWVLNGLDDLKSNISSILLSIFNKVIGILPSLITMVILLIVTMAGIESIKRYFSKHITVLFVQDPDQGKKFVYGFYGDVKKYIRGQVLVSFISATLTTIGLILLRIPSALPLGLLTFFSGFFPFIGLIISAIPMYLLAFSTNGIRSVLLLTFLLVGVNQAESWLYGPKIQGDNLKLHWFVILISIFLLGDIFGFVGILIALPMLLFIRKFWKFYILSKTET